MIQKFAISRRAGVIVASLLLAFLYRPVNASAQTNTATDALIDRVVALTEHGDPAAMEKTTAGYQIDASRKLNPGIPDDTWGSIRADVNDIISNKIKPG